MLAVSAIGLNWYRSSEADLRRDGCSPASAREIHGERTAADAVGMDFLRFLLRRKPDVRAVGPGESSLNPADTRATRTALGIARMWNLGDVERMLRRAGALH
jgi:hypothetical protein